MAWTPYPGSGGGGGTGGGAAPSINQIIQLNANEIITGGEAVFALLAGQRSKGGWIGNPLEATFNLGINEIDEATGTATNGNTWFVLPGQTYTLAPSQNAVSVIAEDDGHLFNGEGLT